MCAAQVQPSADDALTEALEALRLTVEYVGLETLRPLPGWSWFDVLSKRPEYTAWLDSMVNPRSVEEVHDDLCEDNDGPHWDPTPWPCNCEARAAQTDGSKFVGEVGVDLPAVPAAGSHPAGASPTHSDG